MPFYGLNDRGDYLDNKKKQRVVLIGAGIMSATLATLLKELEPDWEITLFERLGGAGEESSNVWNNAGTGHSALCELNYTDELEDGTIDIQKAIEINEQYQLSRQFWSYLVENKAIHNPEAFIKGLPHLSFVQGEENVAFLKKRFDALSNNPLFDEMAFSDDPERLTEWMPLMMKNRENNQPIAATKIDTGTDVNFGALTQMLVTYLNTKNVDIKFNHNVEGIHQLKDGTWELKVKNIDKGIINRHTADFVFIGAGGGSLPLLQKSGIPEGKGFGGFPVSGQFMVCNNESIANEHFGKVYGKAEVGAPPMSVPHLDTRFIGNEKKLLFGPFAGFSPRFLKNGSLFDLIGSVKSDNVLTMIAAGMKNMPLTVYLIQQVLASKEKRMASLRTFIPNAKSDDWDIVHAGQRVQILKKTPESMGTLQFGTEVVHSGDGTLAALLGASPGASTAVFTMIEMLKVCFPNAINSWEPKLKTMIPSYGTRLEDNPSYYNDVLKKTSDTLRLGEKEQL